MKLTRQAALIRDHLRANSHLTSWQAEGVYRIRRLASRISELRNAGYEIEKESQRDATGQLYTRYSFSKRQRRARGPLLQPRVEQPRLILDDIVHMYHRYCMEHLDLGDEHSTDESTDFREWLTANLAA